MSDDEKRYDAMAAVVAAARRHLETTDRLVAPETYDRERDRCDEVAAAADLHNALHALDDLP